MSRRWWWVLLILAAVAAVGAGVAVVMTMNAHPAHHAAVVPGPDRSATDYLAAWSKAEWTAMASLVDGARPDFATIHQSEISDLMVVSATYSLVPPMRVTGDQADGVFRAHPG
jgi:hypothetical protein